MGEVGRDVARVDLPNAFGDTGNPRGYHQTVESTPSSSSIGLV
jgi:hypothetical protein